MRVDPEKTRREILDAAVDVFFEVGFADADVRLIASRANVSETTIYRLFQAKSRTSFTTTSKHSIALAIWTKANAHLCFLVTQAIDGSKKSNRQLQQFVYLVSKDIQEYRYVAVGMLLRREVVPYIKADPLIDKLDQMLQGTNSSLPINAAREGILGLLEHFANPFFQIENDDAMAVLKVAVRSFCSRR